MKQKNAPNPPFASANPCDGTGASDAPPQFVRRIAADDRERISGVPAALSRHPDVELSIRRLPLGDYQVDDTLIVERKTLADFALSVIDGRLFRQAASLNRKSGVRTCLILEGSSRRYPKPAIERQALQGALITVTLVFGVPVLRSATPEETADLILYAARQLHSRRAKPPRRWGYNVQGLAQQQRLLLQAIPEIGAVKADRLLNTFGSPAGVAAATEEALEAVEGIGPSAMNKIRRLFHGS